MATASDQDLEYQAELDRSRRQADDEEVAPAADLGFEDEEAAAAGGDEMQREAAFNQARSVAMQQLQQQQAAQAFQQAQAGELARASATDQQNKDDKKTNKAFRKKMMTGLIRVMWVLNPVLFYQLTYGLILAYYGRWSGRFFRDTIPLPELGGEWVPFMPKALRIGPKLGAGMTLLLWIPFALWWTLVILFFICAVYLAFEILKAVQESWIGELYDYAAGLGR